MAVYMIRAGQHGPVKIGCATDVRERQRNLQTGNHERLSILRVFRGDVQDEAELKLRFQDLSLHGEWFSFSTRLLEDVGLEEITLQPAANDDAVSEAPVERPAEGSEHYFAKIIDDLTKQWAARRRGLDEGRYVKVFEELTERWAARRARVKLEIED